VKFDAAELRALSAALARLAQAQDDGQDSGDFLPVIVGVVSGAFAAVVQEKPYLLDAINTSLATINMQVVHSTRAEAGDPAEHNQIRTSARGDMVRVFHQAPRDAYYMVRRIFGPPVEAQHPLTAGEVVAIWPRAVRVVGA
jgi:hypothetical protein